MTVGVRDERAGDVAAVRTVVTRAFKRPDEARLVDLLRDAGRAVISLVAERDGHVVGHVFFSAVTLDGAPFGLGLAPLAVAPEVQSEGIGGALVRSGLARCRSLGASTVVVLGSPVYYGRFGFVAADQYGLTCEYDVPPGVFQIIELVPGAIAGLAQRGGQRGCLVRYAPEFAGF